MTGEDDKNREFVGRVHDSDLGRKLAHLEGLIGYQFPEPFFQKKHLAHMLRVSPAQLSRKLSGKDPTHYSELSVFIDRFRLGPRVDYEVFLLDLDGFKTALRGAGIGTYAGPVDDALEALRDRRTTGKPRVHVRRVGSDRRGAGIGPREDDDGPFPEFAAFEQIYVEIELPGLGELIVLNERIGKQTYWLRPSGYSMAPVAGASVFRIPDDAGLESDLLTKPPADYYRIYAIWLAPGHGWPMLPASDGGHTLPKARDAEINALSGHLDRVPPNRQMVMLAHYCVT